MLFIYIIQFLKTNIENFIGVLVESALFGSAIIHPFIAKFAYI